MKESSVESASVTGIGATRRCVLKAGGWFRERVEVWEPGRALAFELYECTLPVRRLRHEYTLTQEGSSTRVSQRMEYELKLGVVGTLLDGAFVRRKWSAGIRTFLLGLKGRVEADAQPSPASVAHEAGILGAECR